MTACHDLAMDGVGRDGTEPVRVIDLTGLDWDRWAPRAAELVPSLNALTVGVSSRPLPEAAAPVLARLTTTLGTGPGRYCAGTPDDLDRIRATVAQAPIAAETLAGVITTTAELAIPEALHTESLAYSMLLGSAEFRAWRSHTPLRMATTASDPVLLERTGSRLVLTLNHPDRHNAFHSTMRDALIAGLEVAVSDPDIIEIVLQGSGANFCSGGDLDEFGTTDPAVAHQVRTVASAGRLISDLGSRLRVEVQGHCIGAGVELPAFAAHVVARPGTTFRLPELSLGLIPGAGGTVSLPRRIGRWRTAWLALTGHALDAETAAAWGLIDDIR